MNRFTNNLSLFWKELVVLARKSSNVNRELPSFLIVGAQKSYTSSLFYYLSQHPYVYPSIVKEIHYFDGGLKSGKNNYLSKSLDWYKAHFALPPIEGLQTFEASPMYLFHPYAAKRIFETIPDVKIIVLLRNPIDRAISHYYHELQRGFETLRLKEAIVNEETRLEESLNDCAYNSYEYVHYSYKARGLYHQQIERYLKYFSFQNIKIINSEDLKVNPVGTTNDVLEFLELDSSNLKLNLKPKNVSKYKYVKDEFVCSYLSNYFKESNKKLYSLLGIDFGW